MHVLGARFTTPTAASSALREIRATIAVPATDVGVRPLGSTRYDAPVSQYLLAGHFEDDVVEAAAAIAERHGGVVFTLRTATPANRREWTTPRADDGVGPSIRAGLEREHEAGIGQLRIREGQPRRAWLRHPASMRCRVAREHRLSG